MSNFGNTHEMASSVGNLQRSPIVELSRAINNELDISRIDPQQLEQLKQQQQMLKYQEQQQIMQQLQNQQLQQYHQGVQGGVNKMDPAMIFTEKGRGFLGFTNDMLKEGVMVAVLYLLMSSSYIVELLAAYVPLLSILKAETGSSTSAMILKAIIAGSAYVVLKRFFLIK
ncbi:MAG: hypothetical protein Faunusvirus31_3 [Faunusvirus sp.]|jgi:hypothetical protein|uniref:Uncharacterized protein n=1 Tax=Faunusvirus sp. TaxID=2487766 RepID=A0A3G5A193_9VIRU|nr:MAG: hypothetical protein Faunusvirus31_3 [Faunusvirus sp.]